MISGAVTGFRTWVSSFFRSRKVRDASAVVMEVVAPVVELALPVVQAIEEQLKSPVMIGHEPLVDVVERFVVEQLECDSTDARQFALRVVYLPIPDLLASVAVFILMRSVGDKLPSSMFRLAVELAYNIYKISRQRHEA